MWVEHLKVKAGSVLDFERDGNVAINRDEDIGLQKMLIS